MTAAVTGADPTREQEQTLMALAERWGSAEVTPGAANGGVHARGQNARTGRWEACVVLPNGGITGCAGFGWRP